MARFVAIMTFGDDEKRLATRDDHRAYLRQLLAEGKLLESGPWTDETGALLIYEAADEAAARALVNADPYSKTSGILTGVELKEWNRVFAAGE